MPSSEPAVIPIAGVAALLCTPEQILRRKWRSLAADHGFPRPLPGLGLVWSRAAIEAWISGNSAAGAVAAGTPLPPPAPVDTVIAMRDHLAAKYGGPA